MTRKRLRLGLAALGVAVATLAAAVSVGATVSDAVATRPAAAAAGPTAAQLLAKAANCTPASNGKYATDDGEAATVQICRNGSAYTWTSDMDIDCDGISTSHCNSSTDPWYYNETSFETSTGQFFTSDVTHYYVVPLPSSRFDYQSAGISPGSVAAVVYSNKVVYAVFADEGPDDIIGEGSYSLATALGIDPDPATGGTEGPVTFVVFPGKVPSPVENNTAIDAAGSAAATTWVGGSSTPPPTTNPPPGGGATGPIRSGYAGKCVDVAAASTADGAAVQLYDCNGTAAQNWTVGSDGTLKALGKCMDVTAAGTANGTKVDLYDCNGTGSQKWQKSGSTLVNPQSGKCLDATGPSSANGTRLQIWTCAGATNQQWTLPS
ncbi:ricin-type beta-trefoil lectin domain protein [Actinacidiphila sp. ITFR-21]|uniref:ricin-type beta-trefoil lectin domain protein n=1 Tax=Actinacidiphila sp. ITFR-21 TaxID=3075199 RepID=UPI0028899419|nr:ricin-type beta-trefoil lectin domain protein [Streptomyces sp. ITFR-21]WNI17975.1 RICIN domain-containing protein [Streptomyces sp. ITFR-21]